jgi:glycosyltransferase involved in cell wall biosynthesis
MTATETNAATCAATRFSWSAAVFAHNEAATIAACLDSLLADPALLPLARGIHVLANGCTDRTEAVVAAYASRQPLIRLVSLKEADKASAWNHYVHEVAPDAEIHLMIDGDVQAAPGALRALAERLATDPRARAAGALPDCGRSRARWWAQMQRRGRLAGNLYALRGAYLTALRGAGFALPGGFIGEDQFLSVLIKGRLYPTGLIEPDPRLALEPRARFRFRSLSPWRLSDWLIHARRLIRYRVRDRQLLMLLERLQAAGPDAMPQDVPQLYAEAHTLPGYRWHGPTTPLEWLAVAQMRRDMRRARRASRTAMH